LRFIRGVDLQLTDEQIAAQFGVQRASLPKESEEAFVNGNLEKVNSLLKDDPGLVFRKNGVGDTPLHLATGRKDVVELLLAKGPTSTPRTALVPHLCTTRHGETTRA
jgi:ankyrin repeat protein